MEVDFELPNNVFKHKRSFNESSEEQNSPAKASGSEASQSAKKPKHKNKLNVEDLTELVQATAELCVEEKADSTVRDALLTRTTLVSAEHVAVKAALEEGQAVHKEQQEKKENTA